MKEKIKKLLNLSLMSMMVFANLSPVYAENTDTDNQADVPADTAVETVAEEQAEDTPVVKEEQVQEGIEIEFEDDTDQDEESNADDPTELIVTSDDKATVYELAENADDVYQLSDDTFILSFESSEDAKSAEEVINDDDSVELFDNELFSIETEGDTVSNIESDDPSVIYDETAEYNVTYSASEGKYYLNDQAYDSLREVADLTGKKIVAVIDTGVDPNLVIQSENFTTEESADDVNGHGTEVTRKILENADNNAFIVSLKAMNDNGSGYMSAIMKAIQWAIDQKVDFINLSIAAPDRGTAVSLTQLVTSAIDNGITVIASAGNYNSSAKLYLPSSIKGVISVGAMDDSFNKADTSNYAADYYEVADSTSLAAGVLTGKLVAGCDLEDEMTDSDITYDDNNVVSGILSEGKTEHVVEKDDTGNVINEYSSKYIYVNTSHDTLMEIYDTDVKFNTVLITVTDVSEIISSYYTDVFFDNDYKGYVYTFASSELLSGAVDLLTTQDEYYGPLFFRELSVDELFETQASQKNCSHYSNIYTKITASGSGSNGKVTGRFVLSSNKCAMTCGGWYQLSIDGSVVQEKNQMSGYWLVVGYANGALNNNVTVTVSDSKQINKTGSVTVKGWIRYHAPDHADSCFRSDFDLEHSVSVATGYTPPSYTVTFVDGLGNTLKTQTVVSGNNASPPSNPSRTGYTFAGWSGDYNNVTSARTITATWSVNYYILDVNGLLDGNGSGNTSGYGTFDVYINGSCVANDVTDYYGSIAYGSSFSIQDVRATTGHTYNGVSSGPASGTMGTSNLSTYLNFSTNVYTVTTYYYYYYLNSSWVHFDTRTDSRSYGSGFSPYNVNAPTGYHAGNNYGYYNTSGALLGTGTVGQNSFTVNQNISVHVHYYPNSYYFNLNILNPNGSEPCDGSPGTVEMQVNGGSWTRVANEPASSYVYGTTIKFRNFSPGTERYLNSVTGVDGNWSVTITGSTTVNFKTAWNQYILDLNGISNQSYIYGLDGVATADIYINGSLVADNVSDWYQSYDYGSTYKITDFRPAAGFEYIGPSELSGTITGNVSAYPEFRQLYYFDVNWTLDNGTQFVNGHSISGNTQSDSVGQFDVVVSPGYGSSASASQYSTGDFYKQLTYGSVANVQNVQAYTGYTFQGITSGAASTTMTGYNAVVLNFTTNTYNVNIGHWLWGFENQEGNNGAKNAYLLDSSNESHKYLEEYSKNSGNGITPPNGCYLSQSIGSDYSGSWKNHSLPINLTQPARNYSIEFYYYPNVYNIVYNLDGGTNSPDNPSTYTVLYGVTFKDPTKEGYVFEGWYDNNGYRVTGINVGTNASFSSVSDLRNQLNKRSTGDVTVTARWSVVNPELTVNKSYYFTGDSVTDDTLKQNAVATDLIESAESINNNISIPLVVYEDGTKEVNPTEIDTSSAQTVLVYYRVDNNRGGFMEKPEIVTLVDESANYSTFEQENNIYSRYIESDSTGTLKSDSVWKKKDDYSAALLQSISRENQNYLVGYDYINDLDINFD